MFRSCSPSIKRNETSVIGNEYFVAQRRKMTMIISQKKKFRVVLLLIIIIIITIIVIFVVRMVYSPFHLPKQYVNSNNADIYTNTR